MTPQRRLVYSPKYDIRIPIPFVQQLHPFDIRKFSRAYGELRRRFSGDLRAWTIAPRAPAVRTYLEVIHSAEYLGDLQSFAYVCKVLELPPVVSVLLSILFPIGRPESWVLGPMLWGTMGTLLAAEQALKYGSAVNLSGGYHHAGPNHGEGFCFYADVALALRQLWSSGRLGPRDRVLYIDLDAHQGNGVARTLYDDDRVCIFDMYNAATYPHDRHARSRINEDVPLDFGTGTQEYLDLLQRKLGNYVRELVAVDPPKLAVYNAGTDPYEGDKLGGLAVSREGMFLRDRFVFDTLTAAGIPWFMVLSGGYSKESFQLVAESVLYLLQQWQVDTKR